MRAFTQQNRPIRGWRKNCSPPILAQQPQGTSKRDRRTQRWFDLPPRMGLILFLKRFLQIIDERFWIAPRTALEKKRLRGRASLLIKLPHVAGDAPTPGRPIFAIAPGFRIHRRGRDARPKNQKSRPVWKG